MNSDDFSSFEEETSKNDTETNEESIIEQNGLNLKKIKSENVN